MNTNNITIDQMIEAIRYDCDYMCTERRVTPAIQGTISRELYVRLKNAESKGILFYKPGMRLRIFNTFGMKGTSENHEFIDKAMVIFEERLSKYGEETAPALANTDMVIV